MVYRMQMVRYWLLGVVLFLPMIGFSQLDQQEVLKKISKDMAFFYQNPQQATFVQVQKQFPVFEEYIANKSNHSGLLPMIVWLDQAAKKHHWSLDPEFKPETIKQLHTTNSKLYQLVYGEGELSPLKLDIWWSSFFATGDMAYVKNIYQQAKQLPSLETKMEKGFANEEKQDSFPLIIAAAAEWSFISNCQQHSVIRSFAKQQLNNANLTSNDEKTLLQKCMEEQ